MLTGQNNPLFERPDLGQDDYYRLRPGQPTSLRNAQTSAANSAWC
jgi:hypothetical protein